MGLPTPYYEEDGITIWNCDVMEGLAQLSDESIQCVVTSPPYWGLRDYGTAKWEGGTAECDHKQETQHQKQGANSCAKGRTVFAEGANRNENFRNACNKCGALRIDAQIGLERTPEDYVARMVEVFREVRRVLRKDGTLWLNLGDSYARDNSKGEKFRNEKGRRWSGQNPNGMTGPDVPPGLKPKDLVGIPWRVAFALQADGWYLRSDIIWAKPNPMPESVTDRPTKAHEYVFLLAKSEQYFYNSAAVSEPFADKRMGASGVRKGTPEQYARDAGRGGDQGLSAFRGNDRPGRNLRSVWTIATEPFPEAHFAVFPQALVEPCIKAGCPPGGTVLDPFAGSATVGLVAQRFGCKFVGIELNPEYCRMMKKRLSQSMLVMEPSHSDEPVLPLEPMPAEPQQATFDDAPWDEPGPHYSDAEGEAGEAGEEGAAA